MNEFDFDLNKLQKVSIDTVKPNGWNPKEKDTREYRDVVKSIQLNGLRQPIVVREINDHLEIVDGEQRYTAAKELGYQEIFVYNEGNLSDDEAKALTIWYQVQVPFNKIDLSHLVVELVNHNIDLPFTESEIADFQEMSEFNFDDYKTDRPEEPTNDGFKTLEIKMTEEQYNIIKFGITKVMEKEDCNEARALELIVADFISGTE